MGAMAGSWRPGAQHEGDHVSTPVKRLAASVLSLDG